MKLKTLNLLQRPIEADTLTAWAKFLEDIAKVALLALPVILYNQSAFWSKAGQIMAILLIAYSGLLAARLLRKHFHYLTQGETP